MIKLKYKVVSEYRAKNGAALFLDKDITSNEWHTTKIQTEGKVYDYQLTYTESVITVFTNDSFVGKEIEFI